MKTTAEFFANVTISLAIRLVRGFLRFFRLNQFFVPVVKVRENVNNLIIPEKRSAISNFFVPIKKWRGKRQKPSYKIENPLLLEK